MLYQLHEFQKALLQPVSSWAHAAAEAFINASNPASKIPGSDRLAASYELLHRLGKEYKKPEFGIRSVKAHGHEVAIHELVRLLAMSMQDKNGSGCVNTTSRILISGVETQIVLLCHLCRLCIQVFFIFISLFIL